MVNDVAVLDLDRWAADAVLADGGTVHVRPIRPDDGERLIDLHARLSAQTIYLRFFSPRPNLTPAEVERFTHVDYEDRMALVALERAAARAANARGGRRGRQRSGLLVAQGAPVLRPARKRDAPQLHGPRRSDLQLAR